ncbi:MAG: hypothetical protein ACOH1E_03385 [Brevundimonas sp.]
MTDAYRIRTDETWAEARGDYLTGFTAEEVCRRHDIGLSALRRRARREHWRRHDQADPTPEDDFDVFDDLEPSELIEMAWRRLAAAIARGRGADAARWQRIHAVLHARVQAEAQARHDEDRYEAELLARDLCPQSPRRPRLSPTGENVHDVHANSSATDEPGDLSRAERRRRLRETRRRS